MGVSHKTPMEFRTATFMTGLNVTVRAGDKWLGSTGLYPVVDGAGHHATLRILGTYQASFLELDGNKPILSFISDPKTRNYGHLFQAMRRYYPGRPQFVDEPEFKKTTKVTVIYFHITTWGTAQKQDSEEQDDA